MIKASSLVEYNTVPNDGPPREVSSTQVELPELRVPLAKWAMENLDPSWLVGDGFEQRPHVTVFYGIEKGLGSKVWEIGASFDRSIGLEIGALTRFEHPERDVLIASIKSPDLHDLNAMLRKLPNKSTYPKYIPHMTVAYLKKDAAKPFLGQNPFGGTFSRIGFTHSRADFTEFFVPTIGAWRASPLR